MELAACGLCGALGVHRCHVAERIERDANRCKEIWELTYETHIKAQQYPKKAAELADQAVEEWKSRYGYVREV